MEETKRKYRVKYPTQGIKGAKSARINMAFDPDVYKYIREEADKENVTMTRIVNEAIREQMNAEEGEPCDNS